jgi:predicted TIM-barrel fold metal-dependent hydrolase
MDELPLIVSVDDHVVEPPGVWSDRLPARYLDVGPRLVRETVPSVMRPGSEVWADVWHYEDVRVTTERGFAAVGFDPDDLSWEPMTYDEMRPGCCSLPDRLDDMDADGVEAAVTFPNAFVRFAGHRFLSGKDKELALLCVRAYNDWLIEEWAGPSDGRLIPAAIVPLWDAELAAAEVRRNAARGCPSVCFSEIPALLKGIGASGAIRLPSMYSGHWDPFFEACDETATVINLHIGSSAWSHTTSPDAPLGVQVANNYSNTSFSLTDWIVSGLLERYPNLKLAFSEGQAGWIPYVLSRLDALWKEGSKFVGFKHLREAPSFYYARQVFACVFNDPIAVRLIDVLGEDNLCFETDYPHNDGLWPHSRDGARAQTADMTPQQRLKFLRMNAARLYRVSRVLDVAPASREALPVSRPLEPC